MVIVNEINSQSHQVLFAMQLKSIKIVLIDLW